MYQLCSWLTITRLQYDRINAYVRTDGLDRIVLTSLDLRNASGVRTNGDADFALACDPYSIQSRFCTVFPTTCFNHLACISREIFRMKARDMVGQVLGMRTQASLPCDPYIDHSRFCTVFPTTCFPQLGVLSRNLFRIKARDKVGHVLGMRTQASLPCEPYSDHSCFCTVFPTTCFPRLACISRKILRVKSRDMAGQVLSMRTRASLPCDPYSDHSRFCTVRHNRA